MSLLNKKEIPVMLNKVKQPDKIVVSVAIQEALRESVRLVAIKGLLRRYAPRNDAVEGEKEK